MNVMMTSTVPNHLVRFAMYVRSTGQIFVRGLHEYIDVPVQPHRSDVVTVMPCLRLMAVAGPVSFAPLGLKHMVNGGGAILDVVVENDRSAAIKVRGPGTVIMHASRPPESVQVKGFRLKGEAKWNKDHGMLEVEVESGRKGELEGTIKLRW